LVIFKDWRLHDFGDKNIFPLYIYVLLLIILWIRIYRGFDHVPHYDYMYFISYQFI
jgi:hypothetical protein